MGRSGAVKATALVGRALWNTRALAALMGAFGGVGLLLAALGIYGVVSRSVRALRSGMGLRMALGAQPRRVLRETLVRALAPVVPGAGGRGAGLALAALLSGLVSPRIHGLSPRDPVTYGGVVALLFLVATGAAWVPARRAARTDPLESLRAG